MGTSRPSFVPRRAWAQASSPTTLGAPSFVFMCVDCLHGPLRILTLHSIRIIYAWNTPCLRAHDRRLSSRPSECVLDAATTNWSLHVAGAGLARLVAYVSRTGAHPVRPRNLPRRMRPRPKPMACMNVKPKFGADESYDWNSSRFVPPVFPAFELMSPGVQGTSLSPRKMKPLSFPTRS
jgi:hypothetical protein